jgi:hypothetical protein
MFHLGHLEKLTFGNFFENATGFEVVIISRLKASHFQRFPLEKNSLTYLNSYDDYEKELLEIFSAKN